MKKFISFFALCLAIGITAYFIVACQKESPETDQIVANVPTEGKYKEVITLKDDSGKNQVRLEVSTDDESLLELYDEHGPFKITPVFSEEPEEDDEAAEPAAVNPDESDRPVMVKILAENLEEAAIGFKLEVNYKDNSRVNWSGDHWFYDYTSSGNSWVCAKHQVQPNCDEEECWYDGYRIKVSSPSQSSCVSAWFYQRIAWIWIWDCPGSNGYYLCGKLRSSVSSGPVALHAMGNNYDVFYYSKVK